MRKFSLGGVVGRKKFTLKPLKKDENSEAVPAIETAPREESTGTSKPATDRLQTRDLAEKLFKPEHSERESPNLDAEGGSYKRRTTPKFRSDPQEHPQSALLEAAREARESFRDSASDLNRKLKRDSNQISKPAKEAHGEEFRVFSTEEKGYENQEATQTTKLTFGFKNSHQERAQKPLKYNSKQDRTRNEIKMENEEPRKPVEEPESFKELEEEALTSAFILSEAAREIDDDPTPVSTQKPRKIHKEAPEEQFSAPTRPKFRPRAMIIDEEEEMPLPTHPRQELTQPVDDSTLGESETTETPKSVFRFGAATSPAKPKVAVKTKPRDTETQEEETPSTGKQFLLQSRPQTVPKGQQPQKTLKTLANLEGLESDEDAEKIWNRFTVLRDEMFYGVDHELTDTRHGEDTTPDDLTQGSLNCLALKWEIDSKELIQKFVAFSQWAKQVLILATNQIQALHESMHEFESGNNPKSAKKVATEQALRFNPNDSLYFQSFMIGVEEVVYSLSTHMKSAKTIQTTPEAIDSLQSGEKRDQTPKLDQKEVNLVNLKRSLQAVKKAVVYLKIETKSRDNIEELIDLGNSLLSDTMNSGERLEEYLSRYPQIISNSRSIKYRPPIKSEDSQIELILVKILKRQDDLFGMKKGNPKIIGLLKAIAGVYGRYEHPTVFIHSFEPVGFAVEFVECIIDGLLEGKKAKPLSMLIELLDCLHDLRSVSKVGRSTKFTSVLLSALQATKTKLFVTNIVQLYTKWVLMHSSTEMNEYTPQVEQANDLLLSMYKETPEFRSGLIPFAKQLGMLHALSKSKVLDREILFETLQGFLKEGLESLDQNLATIRRFFRALSLNYFVIAEEPKLLNILYEHITAQLPELKEALTRSPDGRDRRYSAISIIYSLAVMFPPDKIGLHAEYLLGEVREDVELSLTHGYTKPELLMLGGILELMKGIWTFPGDLGVRIIQQVKTPGFFKLPTPSMAAFEVAELLGKLNIKHRLEVNLGHMIVDIVVESTLPGEIELAIDVHGPPHEFRNSPVTLGNQQFKSRLLTSIGLGYFQIPLHVWSLLDTAGKKSYLLKGIRVLRDKGRVGPEDPAKDVADPEKIVMRKPRKKSPAPTGGKDSSETTKTSPKAKKTKRTTKSSSTEAKEGEPDPDSVALKKPRAKRTKKVTDPESASGTPQEEPSQVNLEQESAKPKRKRKAAPETSDAATSDEPKPKRARKSKASEDKPTPEAANNPVS